jgi:hypothetical protein
LILVKEEIVPAHKEEEIAPPVEEKEPEPQHESREESEADVSIEIPKVVAPSNLDIEQHSIDYGITPPPLKSDSEDYIPPPDEAKAEKSDKTEGKAKDSLKNTDIQEIMPDQKDKKQAGKKKKRTIPLKKVPKSKSSKAVPKSEQPKKPDSTKKIEIPQAQKSTKAVRETKSLQNLLTKEEEEETEAKREDKMNLANKEINKHIEKLEKLEKLNRQRERPASGGATPTNLSKLDDCVSVKSSEMDDLQTRPQHEVAPTPINFGPKHLSEVGEYGQSLQTEEPSRQSKSQTVDDMASKMAQIDPNSDIGTGNTEEDSFLAPHPEKYNKYLIHQYSLPRGLVSYKRTPVLSEAEQVYRDRYSKQNINLVLLQRKLTNIKPLKGFRGNKLIPIQKKPPHSNPFSHTPSQINLSHSLQEHTPYTIPPKSLKRLPSTIHSQKLLHQTPSTIKTMNLLQTGSNLYYNPNKGLAGPKPVQSEGNQFVGIADSLGLSAQYGESARVKGKGRRLKPLERGGSPDFVLENSLLKKKQRILIQQEKKKREEELLQRLSKRELSPNADIQKNNMIIKLLLNEKNKSKESLNKDLPLNDESADINKEEELALKGKEDRTGNQDFIDSMQVNLLKNKGENAHVLDDEFYSETHSQTGQSHLENKITFNGNCFN